MPSLLSALDHAGFSDIGLERPRNEDYLTILVPPDDAPQFSMGALFIVADGMGGFGGGEVASKAAVEELVRRFYAANSASDRVAHLQDAVEAANRFVRKRADEIGLPVIGSTLAGAALDATGEVVVFNVGDSRVYRVRGNSIERISRDQSVMEDLRASGRASEDEERSDNNLTAYVGQPTPLTAIVRRVSLQKGDILLLCTDGIWEKLENNELLAAVNGVSANTAVKRLISAARKSKRGGKPDNLTALVIRYGAAQRSYRLWGIALGLFLAAALGVYLLAQNAPFFTSPVNTLPVSATSTVSSTASSLSTASPSDASAAGVLLESTETHTPSSTFTPTPTLTASNTITPSPSPTATFTPTLTPSMTPTLTSTATATFTPTLTPSMTPTLTSTATATFTPTLTPSMTLTPTPTPSPTASPTLTPSTAPTPTSSFTASPTRTYTPSPTPTSLSTNTPRPTSTATNSPTAIPTGGALSQTPPLIQSEQGENTPSIEPTPDFIDNSTVIALGKLAAAQKFGIVFDEDIVMCLLREGIEARTRLPARRAIYIADEQRECASISPGVWWRVSTRQTTNTSPVFISAEAIEMASPQTPVLIVLADLLHINGRSGGVNLRRGDIVRIVGKSQGSAWYQIQRDVDDMPLWFANNPALAFVWGNLETVPEVDFPISSPEVLSGTAAATVEATEPATS